MKKMLKWMKGLMASSIALVPLATSMTSVVEVSAQEKLIVSAAGHYDYVMENIDQFTEETGIEVEVWDRDMFDVLDGLSLDGPAGTGADVMIAPYDRVGSLGTSGQIQPVQLSEDIYDDTDIQQVTAEGQIFGAPTVIESLVMYYNTDVLEEAPATFEDLEAIAEDDQYAFENEEGKNIGFLANWIDFYMAYGLISGYGGYVFGDEGTNPDDIGLNSPEAIEGITYATKWYQDVWPQGMLDKTSAPDFVKQSFMDGKTAAIIAGPWEAASLNESDVPYEVAKIPTLANGEEYKPFGGGKAWTISTYAKNTENAQKFLDWVTSEEQQMAMYDRLNEVPANQNARKTVSEGDNALAAAVIEVYNNAVPMPNILEMAEVWTGAESMMFDAASGNKTPEESANDAVQLISDSIAQKY